MNFTRRRHGDPSTGESVARGPWRFQLQSKRGMGFRRGRLDEPFFKFWTLFLLLQTTVPWAWEALGVSWLWLYSGGYTTILHSGDPTTYTYDVYRVQDRISPRTQPSSTEGWPDRTSFPWTMRARLEPNACCGVW